MPRALYGRLALVADLLPEYRVKARNTSAGAENPMHDDAGARAQGFPGALVPGVTVYAYLTHTLVEAFGTAWLDRGTATVKFVKPVLDHEEVLVTGEITERNARGIAATVKATTARVGDCAVATVTLPAGLPTPVNVAQYPEKPLPTERVPVSRAHLSSVDVLGTPVTLYDLDQAGSYVDDIGDPLPIYRVDGRVHPAFYLNQANRALSQNVKLGPWVHVASAVRHLGAARIGDRLATRGRVRSLYEKKNRQYVELDLVLFAGTKPAAHILHTAIYQFPPSTA